MATTIPHTGDLVRIRDERWQVIRARRFDTCTVIDARGAEAANSREHGSFVLPFEPCERIPGTAPPRYVVPRRWRRLAARALADATPTPWSLRTAGSLKFDPLPFQIEPTLTYLRGRTLRILLADAVGLGKTLQAGLLIAETLERRPAGRALIVVPGGLREQWAQELQTRFGLGADVLDAAGLWRASRQLPASLNPWATCRIAITSIDFVKRAEHLRALESLLWDVVVFDEAHTLCGRSDRHRAAAALASRGRAVLLLTATPHDGNHDDFARLCSLGDVGGQFPLTIYRRTGQSDSLARPSRRLRWLALAPRGNATALHQTLLEYAAVVWRSAGGAARLAMSVLLKRGASSTTALARSLARRRAWLAAEPSVHATGTQPPLPFHAEDDEEPDACLAAPGLTDRQRELDLLDTLLHLVGEHARTNAKLSVLRRLLRRTSEPMLVFTQYRDTLEELAYVFRDQSFARIHGGMSGRERGEAVRTFISGAARMLFATDAASEGLNLHARCRLVVSVDVPWTPTRLEQRIGRVDRIGQTRRVHAWQLLAGGTYEDVVARRLRQRTTLSNAALDGAADIEQATTASLLGAEEETSPIASRPAGVLLLRPEPQPEAAAERDRVVRVRSQYASGTHLQPDRLFFTAHGRRANRALLVFHIRFSDAAARQRWDGLLATIGPLTGPFHPHIVNSAALDDALRSFVRGRRDVWLDEWRSCAEVWLRRDAAIGALLRTHRARLAAALVQPDLFFDRSQRIVEPQLRLLDESLTALADMSAHAASMQRLELESLSPIFAATLR